MPDPAPRPRRRRPARRGRGSGAPLTPAAIERRRAAVPEVRYPEDLPVSQRRQDLADAIRDHQVVIVAGETGSGKTTQLPKICLELGRGVTGMIGHTQPRRLAARSVAARIAEELGVELGGAVGYAVRFTDQVSDSTLVKLMTDGILLNELQRDRELLAYDTIIVDEAHERSLNIDFILGYLAQLLPRRPDLKVIITSATIDPERFSEHFGGAPIIEVSGRTYPVEVRYRPYQVPPPKEAPAPPSSRPAGRRSRGPGGGGQGRRAPRRGGADVDQIDAIIDAVHELRREPEGDILVFLSGEREIRDAAEALRALDLPGTDVLALYGRLSSAEQHRVFEAHRGRRIVLATNVAETSITVPGIRYVIDTGLARISRFSTRQKVQRLPIEPVSQASAAQRAGRCGRVADGICIRLYAEEDFEDRPAFTEPEMLRTNLASVILQMTAIGLGDIEAFPFVDPPDRRAVADGVRLLEELGALAPDTDGPNRRLTDVGRAMARLPVDPRFARMIVEADRRGCLRELLVITAGLSIPDVRERPSDDAAEADALHARFADPTSDFLALVDLWRYLRDQQRSLSSSAFRRRCRQEHLNFLRVREWEDVHSQLRQVVASLDMAQNASPADTEQVHRSILSGLLSHVGQRDGESREYVGARHTRFAVFPGSALARKPPAWVMAAELVETSRLFARTVARIDPDWIEELAGDLVKRHHHEPHWSRKRAAAMVHERVTLYGLPIVEDRVVPLARIDAEQAHELFVRHALVGGDWPGRPGFVDENRALLAEVEELEHRFRRTDLVADEDDLDDAYRARVPPSVVSARHFDKWWKTTRRTDPDLFAFTLEDLVGDATDTLDEEAFPARWRQRDLELAMSYRFEPGTADDGAAVHIPLVVLNQVRAEGFDRLVPGLREELVTSLLRTLPKHLRKEVAPLPERARAVVATLAAAEPDGPLSGCAPLTTVIAEHLRHEVGAAVRPADLDPGALPPHLRMIFLVEDDDGTVLGQGRDLAALQAALAEPVRRALGDAAGDLERHGLTTWEVGDLPRRIDREVGAHRVQAFPALVDEGDTVGVALFDDPVAQGRAMWAGTRRLLALATVVARRRVESGLGNQQRLALASNPYPRGFDALVADAHTTVLDALLRERGGPGWTAHEYESLRLRAVDEVPGRLRQLLATTARVLALGRVVGRRLEALAGVPGVAAAVGDMEGQLEGLVYEGFMAATGPDRMADVERYLRAMVVRLDKLADGVTRDGTHMASVHRVVQRYAAVLDRVPPGGPLDAELEELGWAIEELRVSLFAQSLGTAGPISEKRVLRALADVERRDEGGQG
ncbi:ATP-dependent RNA helicase HrpA [Rhabdothermincola salaria]|uniref:ATP-dependent RNA helicase HrpA n=1 Tax=Rhabdothermincola salaria TaxID=2903142 RepID=UPI001E601547|nr:ATP-dependent RNA helicase HrpA [Rhabdothermincola salaria]MCD9622938.1 ATP-dependent RNA helicase HrpA [Rhabdothermincola salaria]